MQSRVLNIYFIIILLFLSCDSTTSTHRPADVVVLGGGASGTMAAIQSARLGASTVLIEKTPWLGGMLTSAGVSAVDGNYDLNSGLWFEFKTRLAKHYGGLDNLKTGWVSNVLFEPNIGEKILTEMVENESNLIVLRNTIVDSVYDKNGIWNFYLNKNGETNLMRAKIAVDATELGDISKLVGVNYDIGMDSRTDTNETIAPLQGNDVIQDLTYVLILKEFDGDSHLIEKPDGYDPSLFYCSCDKNCPDPPDDKTTIWDCDKMMSYGKLPNGYYMINWPIFGNDYYANTIEMNDTERAFHYNFAKLYSLSFLYYIQNELGYTNIGLADDIFPTGDNLPIIPYHRESRRIHGLVRLDINDISKPFEQDEKLYRTAIAVGDYPIDHHHKAYPNHDQLPDLHFYPIPSYSVPLGALIPKNIDNFIVTEKSISVTNIVNGTTRLQPVCILHGQAAGALAALSAKKGRSPKNVSIRKVQNTLLDNGAYLLPYSDVSPEHSDFKSIQRIGSTGILKSVGKNIGWKNYTYFYPDSLVKNSEVKTSLIEWDVDYKYKNEFMRFNELVDLLNQFSLKIYSNIDEDFVQQVKAYAASKDISTHPDYMVKRKEFAHFLDSFVDPFQMKDVNHQGVFIKQN